MQARRTLAAAWLLVALSPPLARAQDGCGTVWGVDGTPVDLTPYCTWSGFVSIPYVPLANIDLIDGLLPKTCDDAATPELRANCRRCCGYKDRNTCLFGGVAQTWNEGADVQSCNWMSYTEKGEKVREVYYRLGVNYPFMLASKVSKKMCKQTRDYTVLSPPWAYSTAYFTLMGAVDDPDDEVRDRPPGLSPDISCLVRAPQRACSIDFWNSDDVHFSLSSRDMWTTNATMIKQLTDPRNEDCIYDPHKTCIPADPPFEYIAKITEHLCPTGVRPAELVRCAGEMPMSEPGMLLMPGESPLNYREAGFYLQGPEVVNWTIWANKSQVMVMVANRSIIETACPVGDKVCDYRRIWKYAVPGTLCFWKECSFTYDRKYQQRPDNLWGFDEVLLIAAGIWYPNLEQFIPTQTVKQTVFAEVIGIPPFHIDPE